MNNNDTANLMNIFANTIVLCFLIKHVITISYYHSSKSNLNETDLSKQCFFYVRVVFNNTYLLLFQLTFTLGKASI